MGLSHLAMLRAHPDVEIAAVCDPATYVLDVLGRYSGLKTYADYDKMLAETNLDAVLIATPSRFHAPMVRKALDHGLHVFCEKPFVLSTEEGSELVELADRRGLVSQVGYHNRFVGAFAEVKQLIDSNAIGKVSHILAEAYGPVTLRPKGSTWRSQRSEGGGCLYDYAAHPINLINWYAGEPQAVGGTTLSQIFSRETEDEVYSSLYFDGGMTAQLSVNWSDESYRKMTTKISIWGTEGRIYADRQEVQVYLRDAAKRPSGYGPGWNVHYTTELTAPVWFYLRGEEYSAQLDYFVRRVLDPTLPAINSFESALATDRTIEMLIADAQEPHAGADAKPRPVPASGHRSWFGFTHRAGG